MKKITKYFPSYNLATQLFTNIEKHVHISYNNNNGKNIENNKFIK